MYMCVRDMEFTYVYDISIECWNCSDSVIFFFHFIRGCEFFFMIMIYCLLILTAELKLQSLK
jgi:hypothetical protein